MDYYNNITLDPTITSNEEIIYTVDVNDIKLEADNTHENSIFLTEKDNINSDKNFDLLQQIASTLEVQSEVIDEKTLNSDMNIELSNNLIIDSSSFSNNYDYSKEIFLAKDDLERRYLCELCFKRFKKISHLKDHIRIHTGEKPFECTLPLCGLSFSTNGSLKRHMMTHCAERPYACPYCYKAFRRPLMCETHIKNVHLNPNSDYIELSETSEEEFNSDLISSDSFVKIEGNLIKQAIGKKSLFKKSKKPYKCPQPFCNVRLSRKSTLKRHILLHAGRLPYTCKKCGKMFKTWSVKKRHFENNCQDIEEFEEKPDIMALASINNYKTADGFNSSLDRDALTFDSNQDCHVSIQVKNEYQTFVSNSVPSVLNNMYVNAGNLNNSMIISNQPSIQKGGVLLAPPPPDTTSFVDKSQISLKEEFLNEGNYNGPFRFDSPQLNAASIMANLASSNNANELTSYFENLQGPSYPNFSIFQPANSNVQLEPAENQLRIDTDIVDANSGANHVSDTSSVSLNDQLIVAKLMCLIQKPIVALHPEGINLGIDIPPSPDKPYVQLERFPYFQGVFDLVDLTIRDKPFKDDSLKSVGKDIQFKIPKFSTPRKRGRKPKCVQMEINTLIGDLIETYEEDNCGKNLNESKKNWKHDLSIAGKSSLPPSLISQKVYAKMEMPEVVVPYQEELNELLKLDPSVKPYIDAGITDPEIIQALKFDADKWKTMIRTYKNKPDFKETSSFYSGYSFNTSNQNSNLLTHSSLRESQINLDLYQLNNAQTSGTYSSDFPFFDSQSNLLSPLVFQTQAANNSIFVDNNNSLVMNENPAINFSNYQNSYNELFPPTNTLVNPSFISIPYITKNRRRGPSRHVPHYLLCHACGLRFGKKQREPFIRHLNEAHQIFELPEELKN